MAATPAPNGYELFQGEREWAGVPSRVRLGVYNDAFQAIADHCTGLILRGMDSARQRQRYARPEAPHSVVLLHLLERIDDYARARKEHVLVIADEVGEQAKHNRSELALYRQSGTWGYRAKKLTQIVDTLHFAPSYASRLLQAIDLVVYLHRRTSAHTESDERAARANRQLWARLTPCIEHQGCWHP